MMQEGKEVLTCCQSLLLRYCMLVLLLSTEKENCYVVLQGSFINTCIGLKYVHHHIFCSPHSIQIPMEVSVSLFHHRLITPLKPTGAVCVQLNHFGSYNPNHTECGTAPF